MTELTNRPMTVVLAGMECAFTLPALRALIADPGVTLQGVLLREGPAGPVRAAAADAGVPVIAVRRRAELREGIPGGSTPDLVVTACFPWRFPQALLDLPRLGCVNLHPSLLPDGRGPEPVFWTIWHGLRETGVTLHRMDEGLDTGPILAQRRVPVRDDATLTSLDAELANVAAELLTDALPGIATGTLQPVPQGEPAWLAPFPTERDRTVETGWEVARAARFILAMGQAVVRVEATGQRLMVTGVREVVTGASLPEPATVSGDEVRIRFADGVLVCTIARSEGVLRLR